MNWSSKKKKKKRDTISHEVPQSFINLPAVWSRKGSNKMGVLNEMYATVLKRWLFKIEHQLSSFFLRSLKIFYNTLKWKHIKQKQKKDKEEEKSTKSYSKKSTNTAG